MLSDALINRPALLILVMPHERRSFGWHRVCKVAKIRAIALHTTGHYEEPRDRSQIVPPDVAVRCTEKTEAQGLGLLTAGTQNLSFAENQISIRFRERMILSASAA